MYELGDSHDVTLVFPTAFTSIEYYYSNAIWIDQIGHVSVTRSLTGLTTKCNSRHMRVSSGHLIICY